MNQLRAFYGQCNPVPFTNTSGGALSEGQLHQVGDKVGVVYGSFYSVDYAATAGDLPDGEEGVMLTGVPAPGVMVPKTSGVALSTGDAIHFDAANGAVDDGTAGGPKLGYAYADAASGADMVQAVFTDETV